MNCFSITSKKEYRITRKDFWKRVGKHPNFRTKSAVLFGVKFRIFHAKVPYIFWNRRKKYKKIPPSQYFERRDNFALSTRISM